MEDDNIYDYLRFDASPEPEVKKLDDQAAVYSGFDLQIALDEAYEDVLLNGFGHNEFLPTNDDDVRQSVELYPNDLPPYNVLPQPSYDENVNFDPEDKYALHNGSYTNIPYNRTVASTSSALAPSAISADVPIPWSPVPPVQPQEFVNPASISLLSLPHADNSEDWFNNGDESYYINEPEVQDEPGWEIQQASEQVSLGQDLEQVSDQNWREILLTPEHNEFSSVGLLAQIEAEETSRGNFQIIQPSQHGTGQISPPPAQKYLADNVFAGYDQRENENDAYMPQMHDSPDQGYADYFPDKQHPRYQQPIVQQRQYPQREASRPGHKPGYYQERDEPNNPGGGNNAKRVAKNRRSTNIAGFDPTKYYQPLPAAPQSWGPLNGHTSQPFFQYNKQGELDPGIRFTQDQVTKYLEGPPFQRNLILWVQICPADSKRRYPDLENSSKCRFEGCPVPKGTIEKGEYRVAFDEQWGFNTDPFHNAGYVHLFCLEKFFDFPGLCRNFNVQADTRPLHQEKKRMAIDKDDPIMEKIVTDFIQNSVPAGPRATEYQDTLCCALTLAKSKTGPQAHKNTREKRGGNNFERHWNNLDWLVANLQRKQQKQALYSYPKPIPTVERYLGTKRKDWGEEEKDATFGITRDKREKRRRVTKPTLVAAKPPFHAKQPWSKLKSPIGTGQILKRKAEDDDYSPGSFDEIAMPVKRCRVRKSEIKDEPTSPVKRHNLSRKPRKHFQEDRGYLGDASSASTSPEHTKSSAWREYLRHKKR